MGPQVHHGIADANVSGLVKLEGETSGAREMEICHESLWQRAPSLKYPKIVSRLVTLNGTSKIVAWKIQPSEGQTISRLRKQAIPFSLLLYKIMTNIALSFEFVNTLITNKSVAHLYNFFKTVDIPKEHFYATIYSIRHAPGGYNPELEKE